MLAIERVSIATRSINWFQCILCAFASLALTSLSSGMSSVFIFTKPGDHIARISIRREDRIENMLDLAVLDDQREPLQQCHLANAERRQIHRAGQQQLLIG